MRKYGEERFEPQRFTLRCAEVERRGQWVDVYLDMQLAEGEILPPGLTEPSVLAICVPEGDVVQVVLLDEGLDCEFQLVPEEEAYVRAFVRDRCAALVRGL
ncbi:hypothetical protein SD70_15470 [Gordoniibacillus kamchatkensis]|uniref:Uncharacterized protein n=1 Tax=Gordoniibacillus kamchatkensis TaxID=1590651 RepID=A0ABR5AGP8_9BACL|nr:hypothetical protein [Paenibacillus sp. VKM B-2647]KIL40209.1 hypothetical protein SD70_15470 [Paenibacillus sp. VKM B-2647]